MPKYFERVSQSADHLKKWESKAPDLCIVLGSGLADAVPDINTMRSLPFSQIPGFKKIDVVGHKSELRVGEISVARADGKKTTRTVAFLRGRSHAYEGNTAGEVAHNVRSMIAWGVKGIVLTNAAGCLHTEWNLGGVMLIQDHINFSGLNPLSGECGEGFSPRFQDLTQCYDLEWQQCFKARAAEIQETLYAGTYFGVLGPSYETPAEIRMMKMCGASAVGMSTVLETIAARQMGAKVAGVSCLTNYGAGLEAQVTLDHSHVVQMGNRFASSMANLVLGTACLLPV